MRKCKMPPESRAGTSTANSMKKVSRNNNGRSIGIASVFFSLMAVIALTFVMAQGMRTDSAESLTTAATTEQFTLDTTNSILVAGTNQLFNQNDVGAQWVVLTMKGDMNRAVCMGNNSFMLTNTIHGQNANLASHKTIANENIIAGAAIIADMSVQKWMVQDDVTAQSTYEPSFDLAIRNDFIYLDSGISVADINSSNDVYRLLTQSFADGLGGERVLKTPVLISSLGSDDCKVRRMAIA